MKKHKPTFPTPGLFTLKGKPIGRVMKITPAIYNREMERYGLGRLLHKLEPEVAKTMFACIAFGHAFLYQLGNINGICHPKKYRAQLKSKNPPPP